MASDLNIKGTQVYLGDNTELAAQMAAQAELHSQAALAAMAGIDAPAVASAVNRGNLFNAATAVDNKFVLGTGALADNTQFFATEWMAWPLDVTQVTLTRGNWLVQATYANGVYTAISGTSANPNVAPYTLTKATGATHFRVSGQKPGSSPATFMVVPGTTLPADYIGYDRVLDLSKARPSSLAGSALVNQTVGPEKVTFLAPSKNILSQRSLTPGFLSASGAVAADAAYSHTGYLPVVPGQTYVASLNGVATNMRMWCFFAGTSGLVVAGGSNSPGTSFTVPAGANFVRPTLYNVSLNGAQLELGAVPTPYTAPGYKLDPDGSGGSVSGWYGKKWGTLGDSNTATGPWAALVALKLGLTRLNYGVGGTQIGGAANETTAMFSDTRINAIDASCDVVTVMGGTNDWFNNRPLGAANSVNSEEFNGALNLMIPKLLTRFPGKFIALFTPSYGEKSGGVASNSLGLTIRDYADAVLAAARRHNLPALDVVANCGWNHQNIAEYVADGLHYNDAGNKRLGAVAAGFLRLFEPVA